METQQLRVVADEVYKSSNNLNPNFTKEMFYRSPYLNHRKDNLYFQGHLSHTIGFHCLKT